MTTYLADYAHFTNKDDMDKAAKEHIAAHWNAMNDTERAVLDMIRRYSVKFGAAHLKHETMEKALREIQCHHPPRHPQTRKAWHHRPHPLCSPYYERSRRQYLRHQPFQ